MSREAATRASIPTIKSRSIIWWGLLLLIILLSFFLRLYDLEGQSMWSDEGLSLYRARSSFSEITANIITVDGIDTRDTNPPFYFLLLHLLLLLAGESVFALRYLGVAAATLAIPLIYGIGTLSFGRRVGIVASFLLAISPFHIWQAQVIRNYSLLLTLNLLSVYGLIRFLVNTKDPKRGRWLIVWAASGLIGIYTHYFGFFVFAFGLLALIVFTIRERGWQQISGQRRFWIIIALSAIVLIPAVILALDRFFAGRQVDFFPVPLVDVLTQAAGVFSVGINWSLTQPWWRVLPVLLVAVAGIWFGWKNRPKATILLIGYQLIPLALMLAASLFNPLYNGLRHLLIGLPPFLIFIASGLIGPFQLKAQRSAPGIRRLWRFVGPVFGLALVISQAEWLNAQFTSPELIRDDIRGAAEYLTKHAAPEDIIILHDAIINFTFDYYYQGAAPVVAVPGYGNLSADSAINNLQEITHENQRIWFLREPTPRTGFDRQVVANWVETNWSNIFERKFPSMWLRVGLEGYINEPVISSMPPSSEPIEATWDGVLQLHGFDIPAEVRSGDEFWMTYYLSQTNSDNEQHLISLHLEDEQGNVWGPMDRVITRGFPPASGMAGKVMRYDHRVTIPPGVPGGQYQLKMRLVRTADEYTVPITGNQFDLKLSEINVEAARCDNGIPNIPDDSQKKIGFGDAIALLGHENLQETYRPGHLISLNFWWCALSQPNVDYQVQLKVLDQNKNVVAESSRPLVPAGYPTPQWTAGEVLMSSANIVLPGQVKDGSYELRVSLIPADTGKALRAFWPLGPKSLSLGNFMVEPWPLFTELPQISAPLRADFGQPPIIELHGYELSKEQETITELVPGENIELRLIWRSVSEAIDDSYSVFVHLANEDEHILTQSDGIPVAGFRPTTSWRLGEVFSDIHTIPIPVSAAQGSYRIWLGLYDPNTGVRMPIFVNGERLPDDRLLLHSLQIGE